MYMYMYKDMYMYIYIYIYINAYINRYIYMMSLLSLMSNITQIGGIFEINKEINNEDSGSQAVKILPAQQFSRYLYTYIYIYICIYIYLYI
jgi:hypothetical protein